MKHYFIYVYISLSLISFSQNQNINLPTVDERLGLIMSPYIKIYVEENGPIIFNKDTIQNISSIKDYIYLKKLGNYFDSNSVYIKTHVHLFAEENVNYSVIDAIKTEVSATNKSRYMIYRSNFDIVPEKRGYKRRGIKHKTPIGFFTLSIPKYLKTREELIEEDSIQKIDAELFPELDSLHTSLKRQEYNWVQSYTIEQAIYNTRQKIIDEVLNNKSYKCYTITNTGFKNQEKSFKLNVLETILNEYDVVFFDYDNNLTYKNYLKFVVELHKFIPSFGAKKVNAEVIELSNQIKMIHNLANIKLCN